MEYVPGGTLNSERWKVKRDSFIFQNTLPHAEIFERVSRYPTGRSQKNCGAWADIPFLRVLA
jgi:hypothetical protein